MITSEMLQSIHTTNRVTAESAAIISVNEVVNANCDDDRVVITSRTPPWPPGPCWRASRWTPARSS